MEGDRFAVAAAFGRIELFSQAIVIFLVQTIRVDITKAIGKMLAIGVDGLCIIFLLPDLVFAPGKKCEKEHRGYKDIHPDGVKVGHPASGDIFTGKKTGAEDQVFNGDEEFAVEMREVFE